MHFVLGDPLELTILPCRFRKSAFLSVSSLTRQGDLARRSTFDGERTKTNFMLQLARRGSAVERRLIGYANEVSGGEVVAGTGVQTDRETPTRQPLKPQPINEGQIPPTGSGPSPPPDPGGGGFSGRLAVLAVFATLLISWSLRWWQRGFEFDFVSVLYLFLHVPVFFLIYVIIEACVEADRSGSLLTALATALVTWCLGWWHQLIAMHLHAAIFTLIIFYVLRMILLGVCCEYAGQSFLHRLYVSLRRRFCEHLYRLEIPDARSFLKGIASVLEFFPPPERFEVWRLPAESSTEEWRSATASLVAELREATSENEDST